MKTNDKFQIHECGTGEPHARSFEVLDNKERLIAMLWQSPNSDPSAERCILLPFRMISKTEHAAILKQLQEFYQKVVIQ